MSTKAELEHQLKTLAERMLKMDQSNTVLKKQLDDTNKELKRQIHNITIDRDSANKEADIHLARLKQAHQSVMTILATKYPDENQGMFDANYYASNANPSEPPTEELRLMRYLLTIVQ